jgi:hypothetical protein
MVPLATAVPPALQKLVTTPVLASEKPAGFNHVKITRLPADRRLHTLGAVRLDFSNSHLSESASYALMRTHAAAVGLARKEAAVKTGGLYQTRAVAIRRFAVAVIAKSGAKAETLLALAVAHLRRSEGWTR